MDDQEQVDFVTEALRASMSHWLGERPTKEELHTELNRVLAGRATVMDSDYSEDVPMTHIEVALLVPVNRIGVTVSVGDEEAP